MMADFLATLGAASVTWFWFPLAAWTIVWLVLEPVIHSNRIHSSVRYRIAQATLFALPLGIALGALYRFLGGFSPRMIEAEPGVVMESGVVFEPFIMIASPELASSGGSLWGIVGIAFVVAVVIAVTGMIRFLHSRRGLMQIRKSSREQPIAFPEEDIGRIAERMGIRRSVRVVTHPEAPVPLTFGWIKPVIVLPEHLSTEQRHMSLLHELVHIRRHDYIVHLLELFTAGVFGIHPGVIRMRRSCALLRELSCDAVLIADHHVPRRDYADLLLSCVAPRPRIHRLAVSMADRPSHIHHRIEAMKTSRMLSQTARRIGIASALMALISGIVLISTSFTFAAVEKSDMPIAPEKVLNTTEIPVAVADTLIFEVVEQDPVPIGGLEGIQRRVIYPEIAQRAGIEGRVFLTFVIGTDGVPRDVEVTRSLCTECDAAAVRAIEETRFEPGRVRGQAVNVRYAIPVVFRLSGVNDAAVPAPPPPPPPPAPTDNPPPPPTVEPPSSERP